MLGLDPTGQPLSPTWAQTTASIRVAETTDEAFELDVHAPPQVHDRLHAKLANTDNPLLASRAGGPAASQRRRRLLAHQPPRRPGPACSRIQHESTTTPARVTTESWDIPVPSFTPTPEIYYGLRTYTQMTGRARRSTSAVSRSWTWCAARSWPWTRLCLPARHHHGWQIGRCDYVDTWVNLGQDHRSRAACAASFQSQPPVRHIGRRHCREGRFASISVSC